MHYRGTVHYSGTVHYLLQLHEELTAADRRRHQHQAPYVGISTSTSSSGLTSHQNGPHLALAAPAPHAVMLQDHHVVHPVVNPSIPEFSVRSAVVVISLSMSLLIYIAHKRETSNTLNALVRSKHVFKCCLNVSRQTAGSRR